MDLSDAPMTDEELELARRLIGTLHTRMHWKWDQLGGKLNKTGAHVSNIDKGRTKCTRELFAQIKALARAHGVPVDPPAASNSSSSREALPSTPSVPASVSSETDPHPLKHRYHVDIRAALGLSEKHFERDGHRLYEHYLYFLTGPDRTVSVSWVQFYPGKASLPKFSSWRPKRVITGYYYTIPNGEVPHLYMIGHVARTAEARLSVFQPSPKRPDRDWHGMWSGRSTSGSLSAANCYLKAMDSDERKTYTEMLRTFSFDSFLKTFEAEAGVLFSGQSSFMAIAPDAPN